MKLNYKNSALSQIPINESFVESICGEQQIGLPEITTFHFAKHEKGYRVNFSFDFQPKGCICFDCNGLELIIENS